MPSKRSPAVRSQGGTALIVALLILIVLTLLGVAAMSTNTLEEKMAGNTRRSDLAFQAAESALRDGETDLVNNSPTAFNASCAGGLCLPPWPAGQPPFWDQSAIWASDARTYGSFTGRPALTGVPAPKYLLSKLPRVVLPGNALTSGPQYNQIPAGVQVYRITARDAASDGSATVMLQEIFMP